MTKSIGINLIEDGNSPGVIIEDLITSKIKYIGLNKRYSAIEPKPFFGNIIGDVTKVTWIMRGTIWIKSLNLADKYARIVPIENKKWINKGII